MAALMDNRAQGNQWRPDQHDHVELEIYQKQQKKHSRFTSYMLNILYNANTSFWTVTGLQSLFSSFGYDFLMWPFYVGAGIFTATNAAYDILSTAESESEHTSKVDDLHNILPDEDLMDLQKRLSVTGMEMDFVRYAKENTAEKLANDLIDDSFEAMNKISERLNNPQITPSEKQQLKIARTKLKLTLRKTKEQLHDKELTYRINQLIKDESIPDSSKLKLPFFARFYIWLSRNFYTFTTGAITTTGLATIIFDLIGRMSPALKFMPWSIFTVIGVGILGASINFAMNKFLFNAADTEYKKRKNIKKSLQQKAVISKSKIKIQEILYTADHISAETYVYNSKHIDEDREFHETAKLNKPSNFKQYGVPFIVAAFSLYSGYGIAYSLTTPFIFIGMPIAGWILPLIGIPLAILYGSKKALEYKDSLNEANQKFHALKKIIPPEHIQLLQHKLNVAGVNENVADNLYDLSRKELLDEVITEHSALLELISEFNSNIPTNPQLREEHKKASKELQLILRNLNKKIHKHKNAIQNEKHKQRVLNYFDPSLQTNIVKNNTLLNKIKSFVRSIIDLFEEHYSDFFDGGSTICGIAATTLFLFVSTPGLNLIIPVLVASFILGGFGTMAFKFLFEDASQFTLTNVKNTKQKLRDKFSTYKLLHPTLISLKQTKDVIKNYEHSTSGYKRLDPKLSAQTSTQHDSAPKQEFKTSQINIKGHYDSPIQGSLVKMNDFEVHNPDPGVVHAV